MSDEKATSMQIWKIEKIVQARANMEKKTFEEVKEELEKKHGKIEDLSKNKASQFIAKNMQKEITDVDEPKEPKKIQEITRTIETEKGKFSFKDIEGKLFCKNEANEHEYEIVLSVPSCTCPDFTIRKQGAWCKHLEAAECYGYDVTSLPAVEVEKILPPIERKSEEVSLAITNSEVKIPLQVPAEIITSEEQAVKVIRAIIGENPRKDAVIEEFAGIEEISVDVVLSLAKWLGIEVRLVGDQCERKMSVMNLGKAFAQMPFDEHKKEAYLGLAEMMPDTEITTFARMTAVAGWSDQNGNIRVGVGVKEEHITPFRLADLIRRGTNFIETMCQSKAEKKAILNSLPITKEGILEKLKETYGWE